MTARGRLASSLARGVACATVLVATSAELGCAGARVFVASSSDYEDYRQVRMAAHAGTRLARAQTYLGRHPKGVYATEVKALYDEEEPRYFDRAKATPEGARDYLASLPNGPHASAASASLREAYERSDEIALDREIREGRVAEARFQRARQARRAVGTAILDALAAITDPALLVAPVDSPPRSLVLAVHGVAGSLSGLPKESERDLFFTLPQAVGRRDKDRVLTLKFSIEERAHRVERLSVRAADGFVLWSEAESLESLDPTLSSDRKKARDRALDVLSGALEARFPASRCAKIAVAPVVLRRACDGAAVEVRSSETWGKDDEITLTREAEAPVVASAKGTE